MGFKTSTFCRTLPGLSSWTLLHINLSKLLLWCDNVRAPSDLTLKFDPRKRLQPSFLRNYHQTFGKKRGWFLLYLLYFYYSIIYEPTVQVLCSVDQNRSSRFSTSFGYTKYNYTVGLKRPQNIKVESYPSTKGIKSRIQLLQSPQKSSLFRG